MESRAREPGVAGTPSPDRRSQDKVRGVGNSRELTQEIAEAEVLAGGPLLVVHIGLHARVVPAERVADRVVLVSFGRRREEEEEEDRGECGDQEKEGKPRFGRHALFRRPLLWSSRGERMELAKVTLASVAMEVRGRSFKLGAVDAGQHSKSGDAPSYTNDPTAPLNYQNSPYTWHGSCHGHDDVLLKKQGFLLISCFPGEAPVLFKVRGALVFRELQVAPNLIRRVSMGFPRMLILGC